MKTYLRRVVAVLVAFVGLAIAWVPTQYALEAGKRGWWYIFAVLTLTIAGVIVYFTWLYVRRIWSGALR